MEQSVNIASIAKALAVAQGQMAGAPKVKLNPHLKSRYADMESVVDAIKQPLSKNGLSYVQTMSPSTGSEL